MNIHYIFDQKVFTFINSEDCREFDDLKKYCIQNNLPILDRWAYYFFGLKKAIDKTEIEKLSSGSPFASDRYINPYVFYWNEYLNDEQNQKEIILTELKQNLKQTTIDDLSIMNELVIKRGWDYVEEWIKIDVELEISENETIANSWNIEEGKYGMYISQWKTGEFLASKRAEEDLVSQKKEEFLAKQKDAFVLVEIEKVKKQYGHKVKSKLSANPPETNEDVTNENRRYNRQVNDYDESKIGLKNALIDQKDLWYAYNYRGYCHYERGNYKDALVDFNEAIKYKEDYWVAYYNRARCYVELREYDKALADTFASKQVYENTEMFNSDMGIILLELKRYKEAVRNFSKAIRLNPYNKEYHYNRAYAFSNLGLYSKAIIGINQCLVIEPKYIHAHFLKLTCGINSSDYYVEALDACEFIMSYGYGEFEGCAYYHRGIIYNRLGKRKAAMENLTKAAELGYQEAIEALEQGSFDSN